MEKKVRKSQARTAATREAILISAEQVFVQRGFERAQLAEIAQVAGFSKGGLYAHFKSKEDLFLAIAKARAASFQTKLHDSLCQSVNRNEKIAAFRAAYVAVAKERTWALLILEAKLFISRNPQTKHRLQQAEDELEGSVEQTLVDLFGSSALAAGKALGGIVSALVLERDYAPNIITEQKIVGMLEAIFDTLLRLDAKA